VDASPDPAVVPVAVASLVAGVACTLAPQLVGRALGVDGTRVLRAIGVADLALAAGLWAGPPVPWLAARAAANPAIAAYGLARARSWRTGLVAAALAAATANDVATATRLRRAG
jgi:hypothetical protein